MKTMLIIIPRLPGPCKQMWAMVAATFRNQHFNGIHQIVNIPNRLVFNLLIDSNRLESRPIMEPGSSLPRLLIQVPKASK